MPNELEKKGLIYFLSKEHDSFLQSKLETCTIYIFIFVSDRYFQMFGQSNFSPFCSARVNVFSRGWCKMILKSKLMKMNLSSFCS